MSRSDLTGAHSHLDLRYLHIKKSIFSTLNITFFDDIAKMSLDSAWYPGTAIKNCRTKILKFAAMCVFWGTETSSASTSENIPSNMCARIHTESSLGAFWVAKGAKFFHAENVESDQTVRMRKLIWVFVGHTCQKVRFLTVSLDYVIK